MNEQEKKVGNPGTVPNKARESIWPDKDARTQHEITRKGTQRDLQIHYINKLTPALIQVLSRYPRF